MLPGEMLVLQEPVPLSRSLIWDLHDAHYKADGPRVWSSGDVPYRTTTSPLLARAFAEVVSAFVRDCLDGCFGPIDTGEPLYVIELGAGNGRFAWHFLDYLHSAGLIGAGSGQLRLVYVLTDAAESNVDFVANHPRLAPLFSAGRADCATYAAGSGAPIKLRHSGVTLAAGAVANPVASVANYLFNVLRQDLFAKVEGRFVEELVGAVAPAPAPDPGSPDLLRRIGLHTVLAVESDGGAKHAASTLAAAKVAAAPGCRVLYPGAAIGAIDALAEIGGGRMLLLFGERPAAALAPWHRDERRAYAPGALIGMGAHGGTISLPVDLDVLATAAAMSGGSLLRTSIPSSRLELGAIVLGEQQDCYAARLRRSVRWLLDDGRPDDLIAVVTLATEGSSDAKLAHLLAILATAGYDPYIFRKLYEAFEARFEAADGPLRAEAIGALRTVASLDYPLETSYDLVYGVAAILAKAGCWGDGLDCLRAAGSDLGPQAETSYNIAICHLQLGSGRQARHALEEALSINPGHEGARRLLEQMTG